MKIMFARNDFIANEIHESLGPEDIGVLFLGTRHNLDNHMLETLDTFGLCVKELNESEYTKMSLEEFLERD